MLSLRGEDNSTLFIDGLIIMDFWGDTGFFLSAYTDDKYDIFAFDHFLYSNSNHPRIILFKKDMFLKYLKDGKHGSLGTSKYGFCLFLSAVLLN